MGFSRGSYGLGGDGGRAHRPLKVGSIVAEKPCMGQGHEFHILTGDGSSTADSAVDDRRSDSALRKIVIVDLENMMFGNHVGDPSQDRSNEILELAQARRPTDMVVVGCNPRLAFSAKDHFPQARIVTGHGKDGADRALIETIDLEHAADRFDELCIVSGDHAFANIAHAARRAGLQVRVVAPRFGLSTALRVFADTAVLLPEAQTPKGPVAL